MGKPSFKYLQTKLKTATPEELTLITFDVLINATTRAIAALKAPVLEVQTVHDELRRAQRAAALLMGSLRFEVDPPLAREIFRVYEFWHHELFMANMKKSPAIIEELLPIFKDYRATWVEAQRRLREQQVPAAPLRAEGGFVAVG